MTPRPGAAGRIACTSLLFGCVLATAIAGCGYPVPPHADSLALYDEALAKFEAKDLAAARSAFIESMALGGLRADLHAKAALKLAYCEACLGNSEAAKVLLDSLEEGSPDLGEVFAMRSFALRLAGDKVGADAAWAKAKQWNPAVTLPQKP